MNFCGEVSAVHCNQIVRIDLFQGSSTIPLLLVHKCMFRVVLRRIPLIRQSGQQRPARTIDHDR